MQLATRRVYAGRVVRLDVDTVRLPDGSTGELDLIRHPGAQAPLRSPCRHSRWRDPRRQDDGGYPLYGAVSVGPVTQTSRCDVTSGGRYFTTWRPADAGCECLAVLRLDGLTPEQVRFVP